MGGALERCAVISFISFLFYCMDSSFSSRKALISIVVVSLVAGLVGGGVGARLFASGSSASEPQLKNITEEKHFIEDSDFITAIQKVGPSVVSIIQSKDLQQYYRQPQTFFNDPFFDQFFGGNGNPFGQIQPQRPQQVPKSQKKKQKVGGGSGFIVTSDGLVVTNRHVVDDPEADYSIVMSDGREFKGEVVDKDPSNDLALIRIKTKDGSSVSSLPVVGFGDSDALKVGQRVLAIGNALGEYQNSVTAGIVSAKGRTITANDGRGGAESLSGLLQTDAAINPGNSGGPLINLDGQVVGMNVAIAASANSIGFAIPFNDVKPVIESVRTKGKIVRPFAGVRYQMLSDDRAKELKLEGVTHGALLVGNDETGEFAVIPGGPGDKAGLQKGDVILEVDGQQLTQDFGLQQSIRNKSPGDTVKLKVWHSGSTIEKSLTLKEAPAA